MAGFSFIQIVYTWFPCRGNLSLAFGQRLRGVLGSRCFGVEWTRKAPLKETGAVNYPPGSRGREGKAFGQLRPGGFSVQQNAHTGGTAMWALPDQVLPPPYPYTARGDAKTRSRSVSLTLYLTRQSASRRRDQAAALPRNLETPNQPPY